MLLPVIPDRNSTTTRRIVGCVDAGLYYTHSDHLGSVIVHSDARLTPALLGEHTAYVERTNLTTRHMNGRLVRKTLGFSKQRDMLYAACVWADLVDNFARHVKTLRLEVNQDGRRWHYRSPAMAAGVTNHL